MVEKSELMQLVWEKRSLGKERDDLTEVTLVNPKWAKPENNLQHTTSQFAPISTAALETFLLFSKQSTLYKKF